jgi:hypothetical protein
MMLRGHAGKLPACPLSISAGHATPFNFGVAQVAAGGLQRTTTSSEAIRLPFRSDSFECAQTAVEPVTDARVPDRAG